MLGPIDNGIIFAYLALMIAIGIYASRRQNSVEEFFVAGGKLGTFSIRCGRACSFPWSASSASA